MFLEVAADLGRQEDAGSSAEFAILLVQFALKNELFEVDESHGHCRFLITAFILGQLSYLPFQAAGREQRMRKEKTERGNKDRVDVKEKHKTGDPKLHHLDFKGNLIGTHFCVLYLLILLSVSLMWGNFSLKVSFMSFLRSEGLTYSMTVVCKEKPEAVSK